LRHLLTVAVAVVAVDILTQQTMLVEQVAQEL
jgi:hypothetical protein